jgi:DNA helicase-2/ATP-dependent DNA helicase PcrA
MKEVVLGIAGSGKTTYLLKRIDELVKSGVPLLNIAYITMMRNARAVAQNRMMADYNAKPEDIAYFRTMHSIAWELLGRPKMVDEKDRVQFCADHKITYESQSQATDEYAQRSIDDYGAACFVAYEALRRERCIDVLETSELQFRDFWIRWCINNIDNPKLAGIGQSYVRTFNFLCNWSKWKQDNNRVDFIDMLLLSLKNKIGLPTDYLIVDEFQDFSPLMYSLYKLWSEGKKQIIVAGDDDQSILTHLGATPNFLLGELKASDKVTNLFASHRCPAFILKAAEKIISRNKLRTPKVLVSTKEGGEVIRMIEPDATDWLHVIRPNKDTLILSRTNAGANSISQQLVEAGVPHRDIDTARFWSERFRNILNVAFRLSHGKTVNSLSREELMYLVDALPSAFYLQRGAKKRAGDSKGKDVLVPQELFGLGMATLKTMNDFANILDITATQKQIMRDWSKGEVGRIKVRVGTIHRAKGDEAQDVFVDTRLPARVTTQMLRVNKNAIEGERRLRYVAYTRPTERLVLVNYPNGWEDF